MPTEIVVAKACSSELGGMVALTSVVTTLLFLSNTLFRRAILIAIL